MLSYTKVNVEFYYGEVVRRQQKEQGVCACLLFKVDFYFWFVGWPDVMSNFDVIKP